MSSLEIKYILPLLDDEDEVVFSAVKEKILRSGIKSIPVLENILESASTLLQHERIESIIIQLKMLQMKEKIISWIHSDTKSLQEGWILISSIQGIEISPTVIEKLVHQITTKIWLEMNQHQTSFEKISIINKILFDLYGFRINYSGRSAIENFLIDKILISRMGNPVTLNILYAIIARKLNLPLVPLNINGKILLAYYDPLLSREAFLEIVHPFLFFIDVENNGRIIGIKEFDLILNENQLSWNERLTLCNKDMIKKLLLKIKETSFVLKDKEKVLLAEDLLRNFDHY